MRNIFLLFLFICITGSGWAQLLYPEVMEPRTPLNGPVVNKLTGLSFPPFLYKVRQENRTIENPGVRYAIQNLKKERYPEPQVNEAINTLIRKPWKHSNKRSPMIVSNFIKILSIY